MCKYIVTPVNQQNTLRNSNTNKDTVSIPNGVIDKVSTTVYIEITLETFYQYRRFSDFFIANIYYNIKDIEVSDAAK